MTHGGKLMDAEHALLRHTIIWLAVAIVPVMLVLTTAMP
jgi:hypothetical protein